MAHPKRNVLDGMSQVGHHALEIFPAAIERNLVTKNFFHRLVNRLLSFRLNNVRDGFSLLLIKNRNVLPSLVSRNTGQLALEYGKGSHILVICENAPIVLIR